MEVRNVTKAATFKSFFLPKLLHHTVTFFCNRAFQYFHEINIRQWFLQVTQKYELHISFKSALLPHANTQSPDISECNRLLW